MHPYWNLLIKRARHKLAFVWLMLIAATILYAPISIFILMRAAIPIAGWLCVLGTGIVYCFYFPLLAYGYDAGELSFFYPIARGIAPALTLLWAYAFLGERVTLMGLAGIISVITGMYVIHWRDLQGWRLQTMPLAIKQPSSWLAILTGATISVYSVIDKRGVALITPELYIHLTFATCTILLLPYVLKSIGVQAIMSEWQREKSAIIAAAALCLGAYLLVLVAVTVSKISYVVPLRSLSILFSIFIGGSTLHEKRIGLKLIAAILMIGGVLCIALWGS